MSSTVVRICDRTPAATAFLGREREIAELVAVAERERLITLTGAPGIGKSRLAVELASRLDRQSPRVVELAPLARGSQVARAVAEVLSLAEVTGEELADTLVTRLAKRRGLLVLDNCEHVLDSCAELVARLLEGCPQLLILATSREPLNLAPERIWPVAPLAVPDPADDAQPDRLLSSSAVALFVACAQTVQPSFTLTPYLAPAVAAIVRRLEGIPLAIELGAAHVESLTPREIAEHLASHSGLLRGSGSGASAQQTLQAALDWSHDLLSEPERVLLRRLAVFVGGFELETARGVCAGDALSRREIPGLLSGLVAKSLVAADGSRYRLLETIGDAECALRAAAALVLFWRVRCHYGEGRDLLDGALAAGDHEAPALRAKARWGAGFMALMVSDLAAATSSLEQSLAAYRELEDTQGRARALLLLGNCKQLRNDPAALAVLEQSAKLARKAGDAWCLSHALAMAAFEHERRDELDAAGPLFEECLLVARRAQDDQGLRFGLLGMGLQSVKQGDYTRAAALLEEAVAICDELGEDYAKGLALQYLGGLAFGRGDYPRSRETPVRRLARSASRRSSHSLWFGPVSSGSARSASSAYARAWARRSAGVSPAFPRRSQP